LAQLAAEHDRCSAVLSAMPVPASVGLDAAERRKEALLARRQLWVDTLNQATVVARRRGMGQGRRSRRTAEVGAGASRQVDFETIIPRRRFATVGCSSVSCPSRVCSRCAST
jgi:hypothetical protein